MLFSFLTDTETKMTFGLFLLVGGNLFSFIVS